MERMTASAHDAAEDDAEVNENEQATDRALKAWQARRQPLS
jgi:hypothetical protein